MTADPRIRVLYVLKRYPQLSQTFVVIELIELERIGVELGIDALGPQGDGPTHHEVDRVRGTVRYLPRRPRLRDRAVLAAHARVGLRRPITWLGAATRARRHDWRRFVQAGMVADRIRREHYGHVHAHFATAAAQVARDAAALAGCGFSITAHAKDIFHESHAPHLARRVEGSTKVITVSAFNVAHLREVLPGTRVAHIPNGVGLEPASARPAAGPVLCVARLVEKKGIDTLLDAMAAALPACPDLRLEIAGDGELRDALTARAQRLGISDRVSFLGSLSMVEIDAAFRRARMLALPCRITPDGDRDGMPTVILEAMARGVPVISTDVVGIPEVVVDRVTGRLVEADDVDGLAAAIIDLWRAPGRAWGLGAAGRRLVGERFDPGCSARALGAVFRDAIARTPA